MKVLRRVVVMDARDVAAESAFWAGVLDGTVHADGDWHSIVVDGEWVMGVQRADDHVRPQWPSPTRADARPGAQVQQQQVHLDLHVDDIEGALCRVLELGGTQLQEVRAPADNPDGDERFTVCASPAGHPFCLGAH